MKSKYFIAVLLTVLFLVPFFGAQAEDSTFTLDQARILNGMNRSWMQGYEPSVSQNKWTLVLPVLSDQAHGAIQTELIMADKTLSPFKPQTMSVTTPRSERGIYAVRLPLELYADRNNGDYACTIRITGKTLYRPHPGWSAQPGSDAHADHRCGDRSQGGRRWLRHGNAHQSLQDRFL